MRILIAMLFLLFTSVASAAGTPAAFDRSHGGWNRLLGAHVQWNAAGTATSVDYAGFSLDRQALGRYLAGASSVQMAQFRRWPHQTRRFLRDRGRNHYDPGSGGLRVSRIFDWYAADFDAHSGGVNAFLARYPAELALDAAAVKRLRAGRMPVAFTAYDWRLNRTHP